MMGFNGLTEGTPPLLVRSTYKLLNKHWILRYIELEGTELGFVC